MIEEISFSALKGGVLYITVGVIRKAVHFNGQNHSFHNIISAQLIIEKCIKFFNGLMNSFVV